MLGSRVGLLWLQSGLHSWTLQLGRQLQGGANPPTPPLLPSQGHESGMGHYGKSDHRNIDRALTQSLVLS